MREPFLPVKVCVCVCGGGGGGGGGVGGPTDINLSWASPAILVAG